MKANNHIHSDSKMRRSFVAMHFAAGDACRYVGKKPQNGRVEVEFKKGISGASLKPKGKINFSQFHEVGDD